MSSYPSDDDIARMLRARARQDVPPDLYGSLAAAVNASRTAPRACRAIAVSPSIPNAAAISRKCVRTCAMLSASCAPMAVTTIAPPDFSSRK